MTCGEFAGLSTPRMPLQSRLPLSPEAANHDCPIAFALAKMLSSVSCEAVDTPTSHAPQLVEIWVAGVSVTIRLDIDVKSGIELQTDPSAARAAAAGTTDPTCGCRSLRSSSPITPTT